MRVKVRRDMSDVVEAACVAFGADAIELTPAGEAILEPEGIQLGEQLAVQAYFADESIRPMLHQHLYEAGLEPHWEAVDQQVVLEPDFGVQRFGALYVLPADHPAIDDAPSIRLRPGLAFGTGLHETTRLCLERLAELELKNLRVLDFGAGSGILALAALALGAASATAVDNDEQALRAARANAALNEENDLQVIAAAAFRPAPFDLLLCNIVLDTVVALMPRLRASLSPKGRLIISGILKRQRRTLEDALESAALSPKLIREQSGWIMIETTL